MDKSYKWFLTIPVLIIALGFYLLLSGETYMGKVSNMETSPAGKPAIEESMHSTKKNPLPDPVYVDKLRNNRESAYPYFILGTGLLVVLLVLPKLGELSFSPTSGVSLKILQEAQEAIDDAKITTQAVEFKTKQAFGTNTPEALSDSSPNMTDEIRKLEENSVRLNTYADMLEKLINRKG